VNGLGFLALGFGAVWLLVAGYLAWLGRKQMLLRRRLAELERCTLGADEQAKG
jgi:CcmD family protein